MSSRPHDDVPSAELHERTMEAVRVGHRWQGYVANFLELHGLETRVSELFIREIPSYDPADDGGDLWCEGFPIEVKTTRFPFTSPANFPFERPMIDTESSWQRKSPKPRAYVVVSMATGAMMWLHAIDTEKLWEKKHSMDSVKGYTNTWLVCHRKHWQTMNTCVARIRAAVAVRRAALAGTAVTA